MGSIVYLFGTGQAKTKTIRKSNAFEATSSDCVKTVCNGQSGVGTLPSPASEQGESGKFFNQVASCNFLVHQQYNLCISKSLFFIQFNF